MKIIHLFRTTMSPTAMRSVIFFAKALAVCDLVFLTVVDSNSTESGDSPNSSPPVARGGVQPVTVELVI